MAAFDPVLKQFVANGSFLTAADMNTGTLSPDKAFVTYAPLNSPQFQGSVIGINGVSPVHPTMTVTDGLIDQKASDIYYDVNGMQFRFLSDSYLTATTWLGVTRTGMAAMVVTVTAPVINLVGTAKVAGYPIFHSGNLSFGTGLTLTNGVLTSMGGAGGSSPIATATTAGLVKPGPLGTLVLSSDGSGSVEVVAQNITAGTPPTTSSALALLMPNGQTIQNDQIRALSIATTTLPGMVKPGPLATLSMAGDGGLEVNAQNVTAGTAPAMLSGLRIIMDNGQSITGAQLQALLGTTSSTATPAAPAAPAAPVYATGNFWRILIHSTAVPTSSYGDNPVMVEIELAGVPYGPSLTTGGTSSSSGDNGSFVSAQAFDGNLTSAWSSSIKSPPNDSYIQYNFGKSVAIVEVRLTAQNTSYGVSQSFGTWDLQRSTDGVTFTTVQCFSSLIWLPGQVQAFEVNAIGAIASGIRSPADAYTTKLSAASGAVGAAFTVTFTPTNGAWPVGEVITPTSTIAGAFNPATITPTGFGPVATVFTPSSAGTGTVNSTVSLALTNTSNGQTYTAVAAAGATATSYTLTLSATSGAFGAPVTVTVTPNGTWQANESCTLISSGFGNWDVNPFVCQGSAPASAVFTPTDGGVMTITSSMYPTMANPAGVPYNAAYPPIATSYTSVLSATSGSVGSQMNLTLTPHGGYWPAGEVITLVHSAPGNVSQGSVSSRTTPYVIYFTPSGAGTITLSATTSPAMTDTTGPLQYTATATATAPSAFPMTFTGASGTAPTGVQALTQLGSTAGINTAVFNGSGGLVMPTVANSVGYFAAAGITAQHSTVTATFAAGSPKQIQLAIAVDNVGNGFVGFLTAGIVYLNKYSSTGSTYLGPVYNVNPTSSFSIYTDTNYLGVLSDGVYIGGIAVTELPAGYVGVGTGGGAPATITQIKVA